MINEIQAGMNCGTCGARCQRFGMHRNGLRRFRCLACKRTYTEPHERLLGGYLPDAKVTLALQLLLEGNSIRSTERITNLDRNTIMSLLVRAGERCAALMDAKMRNLYGTYSFGERRYSTSGVIAAPKYVQEGRPDPKRISTSYVERLNASTRLFMRRMTRLTLAFSRKYENFGAAMALHFAYYNFCRVHRSLKVTPCMEANLTDHIWTIAELIA
jgi:transposase-like protein